MKNGQNFAAQTDPSRNPHFQRRWTDDPLSLPDLQHLDREVTPKVFKDAGLRAIGRWLDQAAQSQGAAAAKAFGEADSIRQKLGLGWGDLIEQRRVA